MSWIICHGQALWSFVSHVPLCSEYATLAFVISHHAVSRCEKSCGWKATCVQGMQAAAREHRQYQPLTLRRWQDEGGCRVNCYCNEREHSVNRAARRTAYTLIPCRPVCLCVSSVDPKRRAFQEKSRSSNDRLATANALYRQPALLSSPLSGVKRTIIWALSRFSSLPHTHRRKVNDVIYKETYTCAPNT